MNERTFHQETIRGLIRHTINRTHLDLEQRGLIAFGNIVDWTNLRTFNQEINNLFASHIHTNRERTIINNLLVEIRGRIQHFTPVLPDIAAFEEAVVNRIRVYSRYIKQNHLAPPDPNNFGGLYQSLQEQFQWGILELFQPNIQVNTRISQYLEFERRITELTNNFLVNSGTNLNINIPQVQTAKQNLCWCLFNYRPQFPLYRTVLREYIENFYFQIHLGLQGTNIPVLPLIQVVEPYIVQQCTYLEFSLRNNASRLLGAVARRFNFRRRQNNNNVAMDAQNLRNTLNAVLGAGGLNLPAVTTNLTAAITAMNNAPPRELSLIKLSDFYGKDSEDPYEWIDHFERAKEANNW